MSDHKPRLREIIREIMEPYRGDETATRTSLFADVFIIACIIISCALIPLEHLYPDYADLFWHCEIGFTAIFILEYMLRWYSSANRWRYPLSTFAVIDLIAILPSVLMIADELLMLRVFRGIRLLRLLRLLRLIRLLKFFRYGFLIYRGIVTSTIKLGEIKEHYHLEQLTRLFILSFLIWMIGANLLYITESSLTSVKGPFSDYWQAYWHIIIVLISGIEDKEPLSLPGRIEVTGLLIAGICIVGMLTGEIVSILVRRIQRTGMVTLKPANSILAQHIVIFGQNMHLDNIIRQIHAAVKGHHYILVCSRRADQLRITDSQIYKKVLALPGDPLNPDILDQACIDRALRVIVLSDEPAGEVPSMKDNQTLMIAVAVYTRNKKIPMVVELLKKSSLKYASPLEGVEFVVSRVYGEKLAAQAVINPGVTEVYNALMTFSDDSNEFYTVPVPEFLVGRTFKDAQLYFLDNDDDAIILIGIDRSPCEFPNTEFILCQTSPKSGAFPADFIIRPKDRFIVMAYQRVSFGWSDKEDLWSGRVILRT